MKLISNHLVLPLIFGLSLTGVCVGLFYFLYKKDEEDTKGPITLRDVKHITYEVKIPRQFVPAVIGRGGATIKDIEDRTSTRIRFTEDNPESTERICRIKGAVEAIKLAEVMIQSVINDLPVIETYEMFVPQKVVSKLLENRGELIHTIQSSTNTKIILEKGYNRDPNMQKRVIIKGTAEQIAETVLVIEDLVKETQISLEKLKIGQSSRSPRGKANSKNTDNNNTTDSKNTTETQQEQKTVEPEASSVQEGVMEVYVSALENPSQFWVQVVGLGTFALDELVNDMSEYYGNEENRELHALKNISIGQTVAAKYSYDDRWYRAEITAAIENNKQYEVFFVDYGDHEVVDAKNILDLRTDFLSLRLQAVEFCLANIKPKDEEWSQRACDRFADLSQVAQWKILIAKVRGYKERVVGQGKYRREGSPIPCVELFDKTDNREIDIGKQLIIENLVSENDTTWSAASSTLSLSKRNNDFSTSTAIAHESVSNASISSSPTVEITPPQYKKTVQEVIDLTTPQKSDNSSVIEEIDLVTPHNERARKFIDTERKVYPQENGNDAKLPPFDRPKIMSSAISADTDSNDEDSDALEMG